MLGEDFASAKAIEYEDFRADALESLASHLSTDQIGEALAAAKAIGKEEDRGKVLLSLIPRALPSQYALVLNSLMAVVAKLRRQASLRLMCVSMHISAAFGGAAALEHIRRAINDIAKWYR